MAAFAVQRLCLYVGAWLCRAKMHVQLYTVRYSCINRPNVTVAVRTTDRTVLWSNNLGESLFINSSGQTVLTDFYRACRLRGDGLF